ncbi:MAG: hypothetical protein ABFC97_02750 [Anaerolineaceae bacterium]
MGQPMIGITCGQKLSSHQRSKSYLYDEYAVAVSLAGGMPLLIPVSFPLKTFPLSFPGWTGFSFQEAETLLPVFLATKTMKTLAIYASPGTRWSKRLWKLP